MTNTDIDEQAQMLAARYANITIAEQAQRAIRDALTAAYHAGAQAVREAIDKAGGPAALGRCAQCRGVLTGQADNYTGVCSECRRRMTRSE